MRHFQLNDIHNTLKGQLVEIQTVAHIIIRRNGFGVIINHHRPITFTSDGVQRLYPTPVELNRAADTVSARPQHDDGLFVFLKRHIMGNACISHIQIIGLCRIFGSQSVNLLHHWQDAV